MSLEDNKKDIALLLSNYLIEHSPADKIVDWWLLVDSLKRLLSSRSYPTLDLSRLEADHEEAGTHLLLHCIHALMESMVVSLHDTDVLVLLLAHYDQMGCSFLLRKAGTSKHPRYIPVHELRRQIPFDQVSAILAFRAITGCDSVSQFAGHSKKTT